MFVYSRRLLMIWIIDNVVSLVVSVGFTCLAFVISSLLLNRIFQFQDHLKLFPNIIIYLILHSIPLPRRPENHHPPVPPLCTGISKADNNITSNLNELLAKWFRNDLISNFFKRHKIFYSNRIEITAIGQTAASSKYLMGKQ